MLICLGSKMERSESLMALEIKGAAHVFIMQV